MEISVFNIAVCDDMKEITAQLVQIAEQQSMKQIQTVKGFYSGGQLMEYMAKNNVDLLFLDIELGDMTGIDISRKIRKEDHNDTMQIVYMTGKEGYERELFDFQPLKCVNVLQWHMENGLSVSINFIIGNLIRFMQSALAELFPLKLIKDIFS